MICQAQRLEALARFADVDCVLPFEGDVDTVVRAVRPDVLVKGAEYTGTVVPGAAFVAGYGGGSASPAWPRGIARRRSYAGASGAEGGEQRAEGGGGERRAESGGRRRRRRAESGERRAESESGGGGARERRAESGERK